MEHASIIFVASTNRFCYWRRPHIFLPPAPTTIFRNLPSISWLCPESLEKWSTLCFISQRPQRATISIWLWIEKLKRWSQSNLSVNSFPTPLIKPVIWKHSWLIEFIWPENNKFDLSNISRSLVTIRRWSPSLRRNFTFHQKYHFCSYWVVVCTCSVFFHFVQAEHYYQCPNFFF